MPCDAEELARAIRRLTAGGLVAFPTETVWGIAADARQSSAVERLRRFKGRDPAQPISLLIECDRALGQLGQAQQLEELDALGCELGPQARALVAGFWPGAVTLVFPVRSRPERGQGPDWLADGIIRRAGGNGATGALGVRCSPHPVAAALARAARGAGIGPLTATSCNLCGEPAAETRAEARAVCGQGAEAPLLLESGEDAQGGAPSTVVDLCAHPPRILRAGAVAESEIREVLATIAERDAGSATHGQACAILRRR